MARTSTLGGSGGIHFKYPWELNPYRAATAILRVIDSAGTGRYANTTEFFTEMARRGLQDQTDWTANTYKTLLSVSGKGFVGAIVGPTAGGASTTTFEITVDGTLYELAITGLASGERGCLFSFSPAPNELFTTSGTWSTPGPEALDSNKQIFTALSNGTSSYIPPWVGMSDLAIPCLRFNASLLIRAKHSASITNSTSTAYSAVMYRLGL